MFRQILNNFDTYAPLIALIALVALPFVASLIAGYCYAARKAGRGD